MDKRGPKTPPRDSSAAAFPKPPSYLNPAERKAWFRIKPTLANLGTVGQADADLLAVWCSAFLRWRGAEDAITRDGPTYIQGEAIRPHPGHRIAKDASNTMMQIGRELGLSPIARQTLRVVPSSDSDPLADFVK